MTSEYLDLPLRSYQEALRDRDCDKLKNPGCDHATNMEPDLHDSSDNRTVASGGVL